MGGWVGVNLFAVEINRTILHANVMKHQRKDAWTAIVDFVSYRPLFLVANKHDLFRFLIGVLQCGHMYPTLLTLFDTNSKIKMEEYKYKLKKPEN